MEEGRRVRLGNRPGRNKPDGEGDQQENHARKYEPNWIGASRHHRLPPLFGTSHEGHRSLLLEWIDGTRKLRMFDEVDDADWTRFQEGRRRPLPHGWRPAARPRR